MEIWVGYIPPSLYSFILPHRFGGLCWTGTDRGDEGEGRGSGGEEHG